MDDDDDNYGASTTTVPGTMTATTSIPGATDNASMTRSMNHESITSMGGMMTTTQCTTTTTVMTTAAKTGAYNSTFTGAAAKHVGQGMIAAAIGVAGAVALL
jgi:hypothetical protein